MKLSVDFDRIIHVINGLRQTHEDTKESTLDDIRKSKSIEEIRTNLLYVAETYHDVMAGSLWLTGTLFELIQEIRKMVKSVPHNQELGDMMDDKLRNTMNDIVDRVQKIREEQKEKAEQKQKGIMYG